MRAISSLHITLLLLCFAWPVASYADFAVIVNKKNSLNTITSREVSNLYLGRSQGFETENIKFDAEVIDQANNSKIRQRFFQALNGMTIERLNAYWARLTFSGQVLPPKTFGSSHEVIVAVRRLPNAIGYIESNLVDDSVKVILVIKESP